MSPKFEKPEKPRRNDEIVPAAVFQITEPRCHCCTHPNRTALDKMCAIRVKYSEIGRIFGVDYRSVSKHSKEHLNYEELAVRQIIEEEAQASQENLETGVSASLKRRAFIDVYIDKALHELINGELEIEGKDVAKLIELREKLDKDHQATAVDTILVQHNAFKQAVLELAPPDLKWHILERTKEILDSQGAVARAALTQGEDGTIETTS